MSAENVIINFTSDTTELSEASAGLESIIQKDEELTAVAKKLGDTMDKANKSNLDSTAKLAKSIDQLSAASKTLDKAVVGGAYKTYLKDIQSQLGLTQKELVKYVENARKAAQANIITADDTAQANEFRLAVEVMNDQLLEFEREAGKAGESTKSLKVQLREARNELAAMAEAGLGGTPAFEALRQKAGELDDQIKDINQTIANTGSDTKNIDGLISIASGVAGGFAVAQGAVALFGDENEDLQKALLKVNAAMSILQGLQAVSQVIQKESAGSLLLNNVLRKQQTAATVAQTVAVGAEGTATVAATTATKGLSAAIAANPIGLLVVGLTAAVVALTSFGDSTENEVERLEKMRQKAEDVYAALQNLSKINQFAIDREVEIVKNKELLNVLNAQGASVEVLNATKKKGLELEQSSLRNQLLDIESAKELSDDKVQFIERELAIKSQIYSNDKAQLILDIETNKVLAERALKNNSALADAKVARLKLAVVQNEIDSLDSIKRISDAEIEAIKRKRDEELKSNKDLTPGEQTKIIAQADLAIAENRKALQQKLLQIEKAGIDARVKLAQKGSEEEYLAKLQQLENTKASELAAAEVTKEQKLLIEADFIAAKKQLDLAYEQQKIENEISYLNSYINQYGITEERKLELVIRRLDRQRDLEISQAEGNAAKIAEIEAKYDAQKLDSKRDYINSQLQQQLRALDVFGKQYRDKNLKIATDEKGTFEERTLANINLFREQKKVIDAERDANEQLYKEKAIAKEEYEVKAAELDNKITDALQQQSERRSKILKDEFAKSQIAIGQVINILTTGIDNVLDTSAAKTSLLEVANLYQQIVDIKAQDLSDEAERAAIIAASIGSAQTVINQLFADGRAQRQADLQEELSALDEAKNRELNNKNLTEQQKADINKKYAEQEKGLKRQAFIADKEAKKSEALINGALATLKAFPNPILMALAAVTTGITIAKIDSTPVPRFRRGKVGIEGPGTKTSDSIPAMISKGESVINADATQKWKDALTAINENKFDGYLLQYMSKMAPQKGPDPIVIGSGGQIDYEKLAEAIARRIPEPTYVKNIMDKDGLNTYIEKAGNTNQILNEILRIQ